MVIKSAFYGAGDKTINVTTRLQQDIIVKKNILVSNGYFGVDPCPGVIKKLTITLENEKEHVFVENTPCYFETLNDSFYTKDRIGIFYTNNKLKDIILNKSLDTILRAKIFSGKTEIIVCSQKVKSQNYFIEIESLFKNNHHANIATQILQALHAVKNYNHFKYVSFLEHDVLYPEDYFNYPDFEEDCMCNDNFIGVCGTGFQQKKQNDQPLHQMTMKYGYAVNYFEKLILTYLKGEFSMLEPPIKHRCFNKNPSIHVNHGKSFTSHYNIYSKTTTQEDPYWGEFSNYSNLFL